MDNQLSMTSRVPLLTQGLEAARANLGPGIVLWVVAVGVVVSYYFLPPAHAAFDRLAWIKSEYGYAFSFTSTAIFAGLIPFGFALMRQTGPPTTLGQVSFMTLFWGLKGIEFDALYRLQSYLFGDSPAPETVAMQVLVDQFVYCPSWGVPTMVLIYLWKDSGFSARKVREGLGRNWYRNRVAPVLIPNWALWIPAVTCIYLLPDPLQLPLQNLVVCFWVLLVMVITSPQSKRDSR